MFWSARFVEGHDEQEGKYNCLGDENIHGDGFCLGFGRSFVRRTSKPRLDTGLVIFGA
jgi:hypothetical protein